MATARERTSGGSSPRENSEMQTKRLTRRYRRNRIVALRPPPPRSVTTSGQRVAARCAIARLVTVVRSW